MASTVKVVLEAVDKASPQLKAFGASLKNIALVAGPAVIALGALQKGIRFAVEEAKESETVMRQTEAVIKATGGAAGLSATAIERMAGQLSRLTGVDDEVVQAGQNMLLTFKQIGGDTFPRASAAMLDMAVAMNNGNLAGIDLTGTAIQLGKALNDPLRGLTALQRVGVTFTEAQKAAIKEMIALGDVAGAQAVILSELESEFGGAAEAAGDTFAGAIEKAKTAIGNYAEVQGNKLLPSLKDATNMLTRHVETMTALALAQEEGIVSTSVFGLVMDKTTGQIVPAWEALEIYNRFLEENAAWLERVNEENASWDANLRRVSSALEEHGDALTSIQDGLAAATELTDEATLAEKLFGDAIRSSSDGLIAQEEFRIRLAMATHQITQAEGEAALAALDELRAIEQLNAVLDSGLISQDTYLGAVEALADGEAWLAGLIERNRAQYHMTEEQLLKNIAAILKYREALAGIPANVHTDVTLTVSQVPGLPATGNYVPQATGGWLDQDLALVGDPGPNAELIVGGRYVLPADITRGLLRSGALRNRGVRRMQTGGILLDGEVGTSGAQDSTVGTSPGGMGSGRTTGTGAHGTRQGMGSGRTTGTGARGRGATSSARETADIAATTATTVVAGTAISAQGSAMTMAMAAMGADIQAGQMASAAQITDAIGGLTEEVRRLGQQIQDGFDDSVQTLAGM